MGVRASVKQLSPIRCYCRAMLSVPEQWRTAGIVPLLRSDDYWARDTISSASDRPPLSFFLRLHKYVSTSVYSCPTEMYPCPPWERERAKKSSGQTSPDANLDVEIARAPRPTIESPRRDVLIKMVVSRGKFADEARRQKWAACRRHCDGIADCCNPMSLDEMPLVGEIARTF